LNVRIESGVRIGRSVSHSDATTINLTFTADGGARNCNLAGTSCTTIYRTDEDHWQIVATRHEDTNCTAAVCDTTTTTKDTQTLMQADCSESGDHSQTQWSQTIEVRVYNRIDGRMLLKSVRVDSENSAGVKTFESSGRNYTSNPRFQAISTNAEGVVSHTCGTTVRESSNEVTREILRNPSDGPCSDMGPPVIITLVEHLMGEWRHHIETRHYDFSVENFEPTLKGISFGFPALRRTREITNRGCSSCTDWWISTETNYTADWTLRTDFTNYLTEMSVPTLSGVQKFQNVFEFTFSPNDSLADHYSHCDQTWASLTLAMSTEKTPTSTWMPTTETRNFLNMEPSNVQEYTENVCRAYNKGAEAITSFGLLNIRIDTSTEASQIIGSRYLDDYMDPKAGFVFEKYETFGNGDAYYSWTESYGDDASCNFRRFDKSLPNGAAVENITEINVCNGSHRD
jgi:hypothetical protein